MDYLKSLINRNSPESTMRYVVIFVYLFVILIVFLTWTIISALLSKLQDIPPSVVTIVTTVLGIPTLFKYLEKTEETKQSAKDKKGCASIFIFLNVNAVMKYY